MSPLKTQALLKNALCDNDLKFNADDLAPSMEGANPSFTLRLEAFSYRSSHTEQTRSEQEHTGWLGYSTAGDLSLYRGYSVV